MSQACSGNKKTAPQTILENGLKLNWKDFFVFKTMSETKRSYRCLVKRDMICQNKTTPYYVNKNSV